MMNILHTDHEYSLELSQTDFARTVATNEGPKPTKVKTTEFHHTLKDALQSLLLIDIRKFEPWSDISTSARSHYKYGYVTSTKDKNEFIQLDVISFESAMSGAPHPGIYLHVPMTLGTLEEKTGIDLSRFGEYEPTIEMLSLARYSYNDEFIIYIDPAYERIWEKAMLHESQRVFAENEWKYQITMEVHSRKTPDQVQMISYHYNTLNAAFRDMLRIDLQLLDSKLVERIGADTWITRADLSEREHHTLVEMVVANAENIVPAVFEEGIYLYFHQPISQSELDNLVDFSLLDNYRQYSAHLLLAHYDIERNYLVGAPGYERFMDAIETEKAPVTEQLPYKISIAWDLPKSTSLRTSPLLEEQRFSSAAEALQALIELPEPLFAMQESLAAKYPAMIRQATVYENGNEVMSKFEVSGDHDHLPNGVYIKLNKDSISIGLLKLLEPYINTAKDISDTQFILTSQRTNTREVITRSHQAGSREIIFPEKSQQQKL